MKQTEKSEEASSLDEKYTTCLRVNGWILEAARFNFFFGTLKLID